MSQSGEHRRVIVLALDGASPELLERWMDDGTLPRLADLRARGCRGRTQSVEGYFVGSTWPSLYTSSNPGRHGFHYQHQISSGTYALRTMAHERLVQETAFWEVMAAAGKRMCLLDVPLSQPSLGISGIQVLEWGGHDAINGFETVPAGLGEDLLRRYGAHPVGSCCDAERKTAEDYRRFRDQLLEGVETRTRMTLDLLAREPWAFFMQVFSETHCVGHQCWHLHDDCHPAFDRTLQDSIGDPVRDVYMAVDRSVGRVVDAGGDATFLVFSSHGMSYWYGADFLLKPILVGLGVASDRPQPSVQGMRDRLIGWLRPAWRRLGASPRRILKRTLDRFLSPPPDSATTPTLSVDPAASRCFPMKNGMAFSGIRLNLDGREPNGMLRPGEEADRFAADLARDLLAIIDQRTGRTLIRRVVRTRDICDGPRLDDLPDLLVEWSDEVPTGSTSVAEGAGSEVVISSPKLGTLTARNEFGRTGEHRRDGMFIAVGDHIYPQRLDRIVSTLDLAPTFCGLLGVSMPGAEGVAIAEVVRPDRA
jgi:predicted AlkP superfamily phosphohydrolase/phosphomutase